MAKSKKPAKAKGQAKPTKEIHLGVHRLLGLSYGLLVKNRRFIGKITLLGLLVHLLIGAIFASDVRSIYQSLWFTFFSCSMVWAIRHSQDVKRKTHTTLAEAYWDGSAPALKMLVILSVLTLATAPFTLGAFIFGTINYLAIDSLVADFIAAGLWLSFALVSLLFVSRLVFSPLIVTLPGIGPWQALYKGWAISRGNTFGIAKRLGALFAYSAILLGVITVGLSNLGVSSGILQLLLEVLAFTTLFPMIFTYTFIIYKDLSR